MIFVEEQKTHPITREQVLNAFKRVKANDGSAGVDKITIAEVDANKRKYLYPVWNRMASGSYYSNSVRQKLISKGGGKERALGIQP
jgi:retron-type reverse transcriptase